MTDEERQKLCENLRDRNNVAYQDCEDAALEIEQLAEAVTFWQEQADKGRRYIEANERSKK